MAAMDTTCLQVLRDEHQKVERNLTPNRRILEGTTGSPGSGCTVGSRFYDWGLGSAGFVTTHVLFPPGSRRAYGQLCLTHLSLGGPSSLCAVEQARRFTDSQLREAFRTPCRSTQHRSGSPDSKLKLVLGFGEGRPASIMSFMASKPAQCRRVQE